MSHPQYVQGNLGKGWNQLTSCQAGAPISTGGQAPSPQDFQFDVAVDNSSTATHPCTGTPGYDQLSEVSLNGASTGTCGTFTDLSTGYLGGQLWREIDVIGMGKSSNCVYDFYARLAIGSHGYPGSSLHFNLTNTSHNSAGIGQKTNSIPVKDIAPFGFSKSETASQHAAAVWSVSKTATTGVNFTDTCASTAGQSVTVQVSWTKTVTNGAIEVDGAVTIGNTARIAHWTFMSPTSCTTVPATS